MDEKNTKWTADYERAVPVKLDEIVLVNRPKEHENRKTQKAA